MTRRLWALAAAMACIVAAGTAADARPKHHHRRAAPAAVLHLVAVDRAAIGAIAYRVDRPAAVLRHAKRAPRAPRGPAARPAGCPRLWCGCWLALHKYGRNVRHLWVARNWAREGRPAERGCIGCVAVLARGRRGGHVGEVTAWRNGNPVILSGNHGHRVGVGVYRWSRVLALRFI